MTYLAAIILAGAVAAHLNGIDTWIDSIGFLVSGYLFGAGRSRKKQATK